MLARVRAYEAALKERVAAGYLSRGEAGALFDWFRHGIFEELRSGRKRYYVVKCPDCGIEQVLMAPGKDVPSYHCACSPKVARSGQDDRKPSELSEAP